jgi:hypothetical protein
VIFITVVTGGPYCKIIFRAELGGVESLQEARFLERSMRFRTVVDRPRRLFVTQDAA